METIKVALVHDWLTGQRGGEKVLEVLVELFPQAPVFTLFHVKGSQRAQIEQAEIVTSFLQRMPLLRKKYRSLLPLFPLAVEQFDLQAYDLVISSSHCVAKGAIPRPDALHICYIHSPMRYAWNQYFSYFAPEKLMLFRRLLIPPIIHHLRMWDESSACRVDRFVANSRTVAQRVRRYYGREADVIPPPVDTDFFQTAGPPEDYYLIVAALVPYKRIDLAIEAFNRTRRPLKIVGQGPDEKRLRNAAGDNIEFLGALPPEELLSSYQRARALLIPGEEDFGINALEAQACGVPVIAFGRGGATESVIHGESGLFFDVLSANSLLEALDKFQGMTFNRNTIRANALNYSKSKFKQRMSSYFQDKWNEHKSRQ